MMDDIYKHEMKQFLEEIRLKEHWLYALMHNAPQSSIVIIREGSERLDFGEMSVADFERQYDNFDPKEESFALCMRLYDFDDETELPDYEEHDDAPTLDMLFMKELKIEKIIEEFPHILAHICRQAIMDGNPLTMDDATIEKYGFTTDDVKRLRSRITKTNDCLMKKFRKDSEWLKKIVEHNIE